MGRVATHDGVRMRRTASMMADGKSSVATRAGGVSEKEKLNDNGSMCNEVYFKGLIYIK